MAQVGPRAAAKGDGPLEAPASAGGEQEPVLRARVVADKQAEGEDKEEEKRRSEKTDLSKIKLPKPKNVRIEDWLAYLKVRRLWAPRGACGGGGRGAERTA